MAKVEIIIAGRSDGEQLSDGLRELTKFICEKLDLDEGYGLGGEYGYGANYENDVFMMHRFCWCDMDDCPWCGGCPMDWDGPEHATGCYQSRLHKIDIPRDIFDPKYESAVESLCLEMGLSYPSLSAVHCTCGGDKQFKKDFAACQCDWHLGKGPFKYGAANHAPNFWHKPSGFKVWWYKWIGRDNETIGATPDVNAMLNECAESVNG